jgi:D-tyrosyl-tRNA(Tyr) deacylase
MNKSVIDINGDIIAVSQFTPFAATRKDNRPSYIRASKREFSERMYEKFCESLSIKLSKKVGTGVFGADMKVDLLNDGPVTIIIDSKEKEF